MKKIVTHSSPDMDAVTSVWFIKRFLKAWERADIEFVPAGERIGNLTDEQAKLLTDPVEQANGNEVIHVDTGMGPLDHHQTPDKTICGASLCFEYVKKILSESGQDLTAEKLLALDKISKYVVDVDHFKEVFRPDPLANYNNFSIVDILNGLKLQKPNDDRYYVEFIFLCLDSLLCDLENKVWAEKEIKEKGIEFETKWGKGLGLESINDTVIKLAQLMGYIIVIRKDPRKGFVRIKTKPDAQGQKGIDLTLVAEKLKKMDPNATWFLHISKKMLLNGTPKNPKMKPTKLALNDIIEAVKTSV